MGPPCSTWVFMSRGSTGRSRLRIRGSKYRKVKEANRFVRRMLYILQYCVKKEIHFVIEQPVSSLMPMYRPLKRFLERHKAIQVSVPLGQYGALSETLGVQFNCGIQVFMLWGSKGCTPIDIIGFRVYRAKNNYRIYGAFACMRALPGEGARAGLDGPSSSNRWPGLGRCYIATPSRSLGANAPIYAWGV